MDMKTAKPFDYGAFHQELMSNAVAQLSANFRKCFQVRQSEAAVWVHADSAETSSHRLL